MIIILKGSDICRYMKSVSGLLYLDNDFVEAHGIMEGNGLSIEEGPLENPDIQGIILPMPVNCHTHLGDAFIEVPENATVEELVAPPDGLKHRMLAQVDRSKQVSAMAGAARLMASTGVRRFIDFREGGVEGSKILLDAVEGTGTSPVIFGRPKGEYGPQEMDSLLELVHGIGLSAISDRPFGELREISSHVKGTGKALGFHASEARQEPMDKILDLEPDLLVHMIKADYRDLKACADANIPIVVCPTANSYFGLKPPVRRMLDAGITVCLGTDNAMLASPDIFREMRFLKANFDLGPEEILRIVFENGGKVLNSLPGLWAADGENQGFFVLKASIDDPWGSVIGARPEKMHLFDSPE